jgi:hypothetical protein
MESDIAHILYATSASLDWNRLLALVGEHWQLLLWSLVFFSYSIRARELGSSRGLAGTAHNDFRRLSHSEQWRAISRKPH